MSLRERIRKYFYKSQKSYDVSDIAESEEIETEIEKTLWELKGKLGLTESEIKSAVLSLKRIKE